MRIFTFLVLEALLSPITVASYSLLALWAIAASRPQSLSITALVPLYCRWLLHLQGIRPDPTTHSLVGTLPSLNPQLNWGVIWPTLLAMNITGYTPSIFNVPPPGKEDLSNMLNARTLFFDKALVRAVEGGIVPVEQVVLLGAGFDSRLFKFCTGRSPLSCFEVDQGHTQRVKIKALTASNVDSRSVNFVAVDFNREDWTDDLVAAGFSVEKKTFFLWEGVTYYLTELAIKDCLNNIAKIAAEGSSIAFDFFSKQLITGESSWWLKPGLQLLDWINEPFQFGIDTTKDSREELSKLLKGTGFQIDSLQLMGELNHRQAFGGLTVAKKRGTSSP
ncbi:MAG: SAM-dependent methyltransferase [Cyanobacteria bacterium J06606_4]